MSATPSLYREGLRTREWLKRHRWLRLHVTLIALCCLGCLWLSGALLRAVGVQSLALRFGLSLLVSYAVYLGLLRLWAAYLLSRSEGDAADVVDVLDLGLDIASTGARAGGHAADVVDLAAGADEGAVVLLPIAAVVAADPHVVALLWGAAAGELRTRFAAGSGVFSAHPSPLSAHNGFFGSRPFSRTNTALVEAGLGPIDWAIPPLQ